MSELLRPGVLQPNATQLPVGWYFDPRVFELEQRLLFAQGPGYVGHELMVPNKGDYHTLGWKGDGQVLVRNDNGVELLSNVCRHRQSLLLHGRGNASNIVCPLHRWTYDMQGRLLGAPHFPDNPCLDLGARPLRNWHGLLFQGIRDVAADLADCGVAADFDFSGFMLDKVEVFELQQNWKTFVEVYLEDYHVVPFHPGLGNFVTCENLCWQIAGSYSVQTVGIRDRLEKPGTPVYARWHEAVRKYRDGALPGHGAIWLLYYPNVMLEWYPDCLIVSTLVPRSPSHTTNVVEFYYPEEVVLFEREFVEAEQAAYRETAREDDAIAQLMDRGRKALLERAENDAGPYQSPMEDGMMFFHEYVRKGLAGHL
jgi:phenylpropionate dioxygenase-like ring-hydroxylating dioxygenase large terminal subunit